MRPLSGRQAPGAAGEQSGGRRIAAPTRGIPAPDAAAQAPERPSGGPGAGEQVAVASGEYGDAAENDLVKRAGTPLA